MTLVACWAAFWEHDVFARMPVWALGVVGVSWFRHDLRVVDLTNVQISQDPQQPAQFGMVV